MVSFFSNLKHLLLILIITYSLFRKPISSTASESFSHLFYHIPDIFHAFLFRQQDTIFHLYKYLRLITKSACLFCHFSPQKPEHFLLYDHLSGRQNADDFKTLMCNDCIIQHLILKGLAFGEFATFFKLIVFRRNDSIFQIKINCTP